MIVRPKLNWFKMLFVWNGSVLRAVLLPLSVILAISLAVLWAHSSGGTSWLHLNPTPFSLIGVALAIFVSFRNNASYDRYWEARKLWGELLIRTRNLTRQAVGVLDSAPGDPDAQRLVALLCAFTYSLKHQLRSTDPADVLHRLLPAGDAERALARQYRPVHLLDDVSRLLAAWRRDGRLSDILFDGCQRQLDGLSAVVGGCERIATTPLPYAYNVLLHRTVYFFCALLPLGLVDSIGAATPVISVFIAYAFMALDAIASELENPFGEEPNDLPLTALAVNIERTLREMIGETSLPDAPLPDAFYRLR